MTETNVNNSAEKIFDVERIYVKKSTFELLDAPASFLLEGKPDIKFEIKTSQQKLPQDNLHEVTLNLTVKIRISNQEKKLDQEVCIINVEQCAICKLKDFTEEESKRLLLGYVPDVLFPYARHAIDELLTSGSVPPVLLKPISFQAIYEQQLNKEKEPAAQKQPEAAAHEKIKPVTKTKH